MRNVVVGGVSWLVPPILSCSEFCPCSKDIHIAMNLKSYLERIELVGNVDVSEHSLQRIAVAHACSIPFENIDVFCGRPIGLKIEELEAKLVDRRRGGYCFEQNSLLAEVLRQIGFEVYPLAARVRNNVPPSTSPPRTHLFLVAQLGVKRWLVDCGVGSSTPQGIMAFDLGGTPQNVGTDRRRLISREGIFVPSYLHQIDHNGEWIDVYEFSGETMPSIDQEIGNWWTSTYPESRFRKNLTASILNPDGTRYNLLNRDFYHRRNATVLQHIVVKDAQLLNKLLQTYFGLYVDNADEIFERT